MKSVKLTLLLMLFVFLNILAKNKDKDIKEELTKDQIAALEYFNLAVSQVAFKEFKNATDNFKKALELDPENLIFKFKFAEAIYNRNSEAVYKNQKIENFNLGYELLKDVIKNTPPEMNPEKFYYFGMMNFDYLRYLPEARESLTKFNSLVKLNAAYTNFKKNSDFIINQISKREKLREKPIETKIKPFTKIDTSNYIIYSYSILTDGTRKAFVENKKDNSFYLFDFDTSEILKNPEKLPFKLEKDQFNSGQSLSPDGKFILFTKCEKEFGVISKCDLYISIKKEEPISSTEESSNTKDTPLSTILNNDSTIKDSLNMVSKVITTTINIDSSKIKNENSTLWGDPKIVEEINSNSLDTKPFISAKDNEVYFVSDREGGVGMKDIWKTTFNDEYKFTTPVNLSNQINTKFDEEGPFYHLGGDYLYFASRGFEGLGGFDIYFSKKVKTLDTIKLNENDFELRDTFHWTRPLNLGYPINTEKDEIEFKVSIDANTTLLSRVRYGSNQKEDLNILEMPKTIKPKNVTYIRGYIYDDSTQVRLSAKFEIINTLNNNTEFRAYSSRKQGQFILPLVSGNRYLINITKEGYLYQSSSINLIDSSEFLAPMIMKIPLTKIKKDGKFTLSNLLFASNSDSLQPDGINELSKFMEFMKINKSIYIQVTGFTDSIGTEEANLALSIKRAKAVADHLVKNGLDRKKVEYDGKGEQEPIASNSTELGRIKNRRTEVKIWKVETVYSED